MNRLDRALGIVMLLSQGRTWPAERLAEHFEVSVRSIYRDIDTLSELGVPVVGERGAGGGYRLLEGYVLPPLNLSRQEAIALVLGVALLRNLSTAPFREQLETAEGKMLSALPGDVRRVLARARELIAFECMAVDVFHRELSPPSQGVEHEAVNAFAQAILDVVSVRIDYVSPYRGAPERLEAVPQGLLWDRDHWYLVASIEGEPDERMLRADRVTSITHVRALSDPPQRDVRGLLGRAWLGRAMRGWMEAGSTSVRIRMSAEQAERLQDDWFYGQALFEDMGDHHVMTYAEADPSRVCELVRWLGPSAELLEPVELREELARQFAELARSYA